MELYGMLTGISQTPTGLFKKKKIHLLNSYWYNKEKKVDFQVVLNLQPIT